MKLVSKLEPIKSESTQLMPKTLSIDSKQIIKNQESKQKEEEIKLGEARERKKREDKQAAQLRESKVN
jgi:hypothetical protein